MTGLPATGYLGYARQRAAEARRVIDTHTTCAYTGVCQGCGRPGPCPDQMAARSELAHAAARAAAAEGTTTAVRLATGAVNELRDVCLSVEAAADRATGYLDDGSPPLSTLARQHWDAAILDAWRTLALVRAGLAEARRLDGADPASADDVLDGLRAARHDAERAMVGLDRLRRRLATAEDRLRRADASPRARVVVGHWRTALRRLDLAAARLAVGLRTLDRYADHAHTSTAPAGTEVDGGSGRSVALDRALHPACGTPIAEVTAGARTAAAVLLAHHPWGGWRGLLARLHRQRRIERERYGWVL